MKFDFTICGTQHISLGCEAAFAAHNRPTHYSFEQYDDGATALFVYWRKPEAASHLIPMSFDMTEPLHLSLFIEGWAGRGDRHGENEYSFNTPTVRGYRVSNSPLYNYEDSGFNESDIFIAIEPVHVELT